MIWYDIAQAPGAGSPATGGRRNATAVDFSVPVQVKAEHHGGQGARFPPRTSDRPLAAGGSRAPGTGGRTGEARKGLAGQRPCAAAPVCWEFGLGGEQLSTHCPT